MTSQVITSEQLESLLKKERQRGYSNGYIAGKAKAQQGITAEALRKQKQAFVDRAFLVALPFAMTQSVWKMNGNLTKTANERVRFAWELAELAWKNRK